MNMDDKLDLLKQIKEVDTPPFLLTRIRQRIETLYDVEAPVKWKWTFAVASFAILVLNISIFLNLVNTTEEKTAGIETVVNSMNIASTNNIYNE
ncbi:hypothetical protein ADIARSV_2313 [Arcticibacter svalbardensis MN12-7]|uniref:Uncharacterized protein n=2 Tax=Arcticibacter TaxID=1288026 RepID=R9GRJ1_9SPHI|nr:hypothetical protein ADIARSV_2313 [Arcticibacter svalbardensis MN12-7]